MIKTIVDTREGFWKKLPGTGWWRKEHFAMPNNETWTGPFYKKQHAYGPTFDHGLYFYTVNVYWCWRKPK